MEMTQSSSTYQFNQDFLTAVNEASDAVGTHDGRDEPSANEAARRWTMGVVAAARGSGRITISRAAEGDNHRIKKIV
jgi:hypothetical protein